MPCLDELCFQMVIVDEATQAVEPASLIPIIHSATKFVLVGDQNQLGPTISGDAAIEMKQCGYGDSLFQRLVSNGMDFVLLDTQYRMHPAISDFPNRCFYNGQLRDGVGANDRRSPSLGFPTPLLFLDVDGLEERHNKSYANMSEVKAVMLIVARMRHCGVEGKRIGVIAPYSAQVIQLRSMFPRIRHSDIKIASVDSFQGGERDYIVVSCVRAHPATHTIGFLNDDARLNVLLTRARFGLVIIGHRATLEMNKNWNLLVKHFERNKALFRDLPDVATVELPTHDRLVIRPGSFHAEPGFGMESVCASITGATMRVVWPDVQKDIDSLAAWTAAQIEKLENGKQVTIAFDTECVCLQFGAVFNDNFDVLTPSKPIPPIGQHDGFLVFFYTKNGTLTPEVPARVIKPLFEHPRVTILTFDFTEDIQKLQDFGIAPNTTRLIDAQLWGRSEAVSQLRGKGFRGLGPTVRNIENDDPCAAQARDWVVSGQKDFPWDANRFLMLAHKLPETAITTKVFLEYSANDIPLTAIAVREVLWRGDIRQVMAATQAKLAECQELEQTFKMPPGLFRQAEFARSHLSLAMQGSFAESDATEDLLKMWANIGKLLMIHKATETLSDCTLVRIDATTEGTMHKRLEKLDDLLKRPQHLDNLRTLAELARPPGVEEQPIEESF
jgi:hypothetical protein